ncbi:MAG: ABC transporter substrate-binding protein [Candidatus Pacebacteria bacterium]|nr:ABC transporter substrate-binding protein [Candidatus Paceibacterota bacterium]
MILKKWPSRKQWGLLFEVLDLKEKTLFLFFSLIFVLSFLFISLNFYFSNTKIVPAKGGVHIEGIVGQPRFVNPIYLESDTDKDLVEVIFSGLMKYDENLGIIPDLAESYQVEEDGRTYRVFLRDGIVWQDGEPITSEDVLFTIKTIQNPDFKSHFRPNWLGVDIEKISEKEIKFKLKRPYASFLENLTIKIMPKHIWQDVPSQKFFTDIHQSEPIGSGPYKIKERKVIQNITEYIVLSKNPNYHGKEPFIEELKFVFFENEEKALSAIDKKEINGLYLSSIIKTNLNVYRLYFPRYFAIFFNLEKSELLKDADIRKALNYGTDKNALVKNILKEKEDTLAERQIATSPVLPSLYKVKEPVNNYLFNKEKAGEIFDKAGFKLNQEGFREKIIEKENSFQFKTELKLGSRGKEVEELQRCLSRFEDIYKDGEISGYFGENTKEAVNAFQEKYREDILDPSGLSEGTGTVGNATSKKLNEICFKNSKDTIPLSFTLKTIEHPVLIKIGEILKTQWEEIGIKLNIEAVPREEREQELIRPRNYEMLLLGTVLGGIPDFFPFWHSSQKEDPGYNFSLYENKDADKILEEIRETLDEEKRKEKMALLQEIIIKDAPSIFLYSPEFIYIAKAKGIKTEKIADPSKRFADIENWFLRTKRIWN